VSHIASRDNGAIALTVFNCLLNEHSAWVIDPRFHPVDSRYDLTAAKATADADTYAKLLEKQRAAR
tara:strand:- start:306 stop:503 length:198 start_codon:yes stop_codon:yes gene_type:complete